MDDQNKATRSVQVVRACMLIALVIYFVLTMRLPATSHSTSLGIIEAVVGLLSLMCVNSVLFFNRKYVRKAGEVLRQQPNDPKASKRWRVGYIAIYAIGFAIALYGMILHFFGAPGGHVIPFFLVGGLIILCLRPRSGRETVDGT